MCSPPRAEIAPAVGVRRQLPTMATSRTLPPMPPADNDSQGHNRSGADPGKSHPWSTVRNASAIGQPAAWANLYLHPARLASSRRVKTAAVVRSPCSDACCGPTSATGGTRRRDAPRPYGRGRCGSGDRDGWRRGLCRTGSERVCRRRETGSHPPGCATPGLRPIAVCVIFNACFRASAPVLSEWNALVTLRPEGTGHCAAECWEQIARGRLG